MTKRRITSEIKKELERIRSISRDGRLHWEDVVNAARNLRNPLHGYFDFSPKAALEHYLRAQAEELIASYTVVIQTEDGSRVRTRAFVSLTTDRQSGGGYRSVVEVMSDEDLKRQLLADALAELAGFKRKYEKLKELSNILKAIDDLERRHGNKETKRRRTSRPAHEARAVGI